MNKKLLSLIFLGFLSTNIHYLHADDNEIRIDQSGDTLTLLIDQVGFGNTISQTNGGSDKMVITGTTLSFNIDQIGNSNKIFNSSRDTLFNGFIIIRPLICNFMFSTLLVLQKRLVLYCCLSTLECLASN